MKAEIAILKYTDVLEGPRHIPGEDLRHGLDEIFFQSSNTKSFESTAVRAAFRERWLGRYLAHDPQWAYVAIDGTGCVAGYLAGCLDDPARTPRFGDIGYFERFGGLTARYPAHLHVNVREGLRSSGLGSQLVARFCKDAADAGAPGVHVVTSRGARNVQFYARLGFHEAGRDGEGAREVVFLAKDLKDSGP